MIGQVLLGLSILIVLHELGHFWAARAFGIKVEKFYLFFDAWGVKLFKFNYKGCEYGIGWLPLGGYVKIAGMIDESMDTEQMKGEPQPWEFRSKPAWQRLIVMLGGIIVNVVLGVFIFWMLTFKYGETFVDNSRLTDGIVPGIIGKEIGLEVGDHILEIDGEEVVWFNELTSPKVLMGGVDLTVQRGNELTTVHVPANILNSIADHDRNEFVTERTRLGSIVLIAPGSLADEAGLQVGDSIIRINDKPFAFFDEFQTELFENKGGVVSLSLIRDTTTMNLVSAVSDAGTIGINYSGRFDLPFEQFQYGFFEALPVGAAKAWGTVADNVKGFGKIFKGEVRADKALAGPVGIATMFGTEVNWLRFWTLVGLLSMILAFMNLLPIPALDGGHVLFLLVEIVQGKPLSDRFLERAQIAGFFIVVALMVFILGNDILKLFK